MQSHLNALNDRLCQVWRVCIRLNKHLKKHAWQAAVVETACLGVLALGNPQATMVTKELEGEADEYACYTQQDKKAKVNVKQEKALSEELDTLIIQCDVSRCQQRGESTKHHRIDHQPIITAIQRRFCFTAQGDLILVILMQILGFSKLNWPDMYSCLDFCQRELLFRDNIDKLIASSICELRLVNRYPHNSKTH